MSSTGYVSPLNATQFSAPDFWGTRVELHENDYQKRMGEIFKSKAYMALGATLLFAGSGAFIAGSAFYLSAVPLFAGTISLFVGVKKYFEHSAPTQDRATKLEMDKQLFSDLLSSCPFSRSPGTIDMKNFLLKKQDSIVDYLIAKTKTSSASNVSACNLYANFKTIVEGYKYYHLLPDTTKLIDEHLKCLVNNIALNGTREEFSKAAKEQNFSRKDTLTAIDTLYKEKGLIAFINFCGFTPTADIADQIISINETVIPYFLQIDNNNVTLEEIAAVRNLCDYRNIAQVANKLPKCPAYQKELLREQAEALFNQQSTFPQKEKDAFDAAQEEVDVHKYNYDASEKKLDSLSAKRNHILDARMKILSQEQEPLKTLFKLIQEECGEELRCLEISGAFASQRTILETTIIDWVTPESLLKKLYDYLGPLRDAAFEDYKKHNRNPPVSHVDLLKKEEDYQKALEVYEVAKKAFIDDYIQKNSPQK